jgi:sRNA-binding protein
LVEGQPRIDLEGNMAGVPTEAEREIARIQLATWREKQRERKKKLASQSGAAVPKQKAGKAQVHVP